MRIWSIHPKYLDSKGLVALWRETLLAKKVLNGQTKGYKHHPQLQRFKALAEPTDAINYYLSEVWTEAKRRNYKFDQTKFKLSTSIIFIPVTTQQLEFETEHLKKKFQKRDTVRFEKYKNYFVFDVHPLFTLIKGKIEPWEKIS